MATVRIGICGPIATSALAGILGTVPSGSPPGRGGSPVNYLIAELVRRGHEVVAVSCDSGVEPGHEVVLGNQSLKLRYGPYRPQRRARDAFAVERRYIGEALKRERLDIVHAHWSYEYALGAIASGLPTIITVHDWAPAILRHHRNPYRLVRLFMQASSLRQGEAFTAVSPYIQRRVAPFAAGPVAVVPNGLSADSFGFAPATPKSATSVVSINNGFSRLKNVATLIRAFNIVQAEFPDLELQLSGVDYEPGGPAARWAAEKSLGKGVKFLGRVPYDTLRQGLGHADLMVHPSFEESFGMVIVEAMAQGVPVIGGARSGAVPWILEMGNAGVLADVSSVNSLANSMRLLLRDDALRLRVGQSGYRRAKEAFDIRLVADLYEEQYQAFLGRHRP